VNRNVIITYYELPQPWEYFGRVFKLTYFNGIGDVITNERDLRPNYPNHLDFAETSGYKLAIRLVRYIKAGRLDIYQSEVLI
jgi:hypothetical protein